MRPQVRNLVIALWVLVAIAAGGLATLYYLSGQPAGTGTSAPSVGGPFTLVDHNGETVTEADFEGRWMMIYFGFTYCPDVCPTSLTEMTHALDLLGEDAANVVPVMISVDPERDTPEHLKGYVSNFHPRMVGLTGTKEQVAAAAREYRVYYAKAPGSSGSVDADDYLMDHSSIVYLVGPDGAFRQHFAGPSIDAEIMAERLRELL